MKKVFIYLADGFEEIEAVSVIDVLRRAGLDVSTVSVTGSKSVVGAHCITILADVLFEEAENSKGDMVVLPGGMPGTTSLGNHSGLSIVLRAYAEAGKYIAAICAAPSVLGKLGLLKSKSATCYPGFEQYLEGAAQGEEIVVHDNNLITSKGPGTAIHFALKLVEVLVDRNTAEQLRAGMIVQ